MLDTIPPTESSTSTDERIVVLVLPELLAKITDPAQLRGGSAASVPPIRVLFCLTESPDPALATSAGGAGGEVEILAGPTVAIPQTAAHVLSAPPGTTPDQLREFALALADVVLVAPEIEQTDKIRELIRMIEELGKPIVVPGDPIPSLPPRADVTSGLDPDVPGWHARGRRVFGRIEQAILELFAFNWRGSSDAGIARSWARLKKCFGPGWAPRPYFAPESWRELAPDRAARDPSAEIEVGFEALDRSALYGSYIYRDLVWVENLGAAFAVFAAVEGHLVGSEQLWPVLELATLLLVAALALGTRRVNLQDRWSACRFGAEQLRIARMSLPLLVTPRALLTSDKSTDGGPGGHGTEFGLQALAQVKRIVRDQGLPRLDPGFTPVQAAAWLGLIVADQRTYHRLNHLKLHHAERWLRGFSLLIFVAAILAVVTHFFDPKHWLLLVTAAAPAFAAAFFAAGTRLGIVHRTALSIEAERELAKVEAGIADLARGFPQDEAAWRELRRLASIAAEAMGRENTSWHSLVCRHRDEFTS
jgi:hypothetical protein